MRDGQGWIIVTTAGLALVTGLQMLAIEMLDIRISRLESQEKSRTNMTCGPLFFSKPRQESHTQ